MKRMDKYWIYWWLKRWNEWINIKYIDEQKKQNAWINNKYKGE